MGDESDIPALVKQWQKNSFVLERRNILDAMDLIGQKSAKQFLIGDKVCLVSFENKQKPLCEVMSGDHYWLLIGQKGIVLETKNRRALIEFSCDVNTFGVHCHNDIKNTLWIAFEDLEKENI